MKMSQTNKPWILAPQLSVNLHPGWLQSPAVEPALQRCKVPTSRLSLGSICFPCGLFVFWFSIPISHLFTSRNGCPALEILGPDAASEEYPGIAKWASPWDPLPILQVVWHLSSRNELTQQKYINIYWLQAQNKNFVPELMGFKAYSCMSVFFHNLVLLVWGLPTKWSHFWPAY